MPPQSLTESMGTLMGMSATAFSRLNQIIGRLKPTPEICGKDNAAVQSTPALPTMANIATQNIQACFKAIDEIESILFG